MPYFLSRKMTGLFYPQHVLYVKCSEFAFEDCCKQGNLRAALEYGEMCINAYRYNHETSTRDISLLLYTCKKCSFQKIRGPLLAQRWHVPLPAWDGQ